jgi:probable HAF family extracellular repeat protein
MVSLGTLNGGVYSRAAAISADGNVIVGLSADGSAGNVERAFRWTQVGGMVSLGTLGGLSSNAFAASSDGRVVVGHSADSSAGGASRAFRWTQATGMLSLGTLNAGNLSYARGVSADGSVVVGYANDGAASNAQRAFRWTQAGGMVSLGAINGGSASSARGVSADGRVVVGDTNDGAAGNASRAFRWTQAGGMQTISQWLAAAGTTVAPSFIANSGNAVSSDGSVVVGSTTDKVAYLARVSPQGSGAIIIPAYIRTLPILPQVQQIADADLVLHGLHGSPMRHLLQAGGQGAWVAGDIGRFSKGDNQGGVGAGEVGFAYGLSDNVMLKMAIGRTYSRQDLVDSGRIGNQGSFIVPEVIVRLPAAPDVRLSTSGYYNWGSADIRRNYLNAGVMAGASGSPATSTAALRLRADWIDALAWQDVSLSPYVSLTHYRGRVAAYTETGGGFPVAWNSRAEHATQARLGADAAWRFDDNLTLTARLEGVRRLNREGGGASGTLVGPGGFAFDLPGQTYKQNWLRAGVGLEAQAGPGVASAMLNVSTQDDGPKRWAYASYRISW